MKIKNVSAPTWYIIAATIAVAAFLVYGLVGCGLQDGTTATVPAAATATASDSGTTADAAPTPATFDGDTDAPPPAPKPDSGVVVDSGKSDTGVAITDSGTTPADSGVDTGVAIVDAGVDTGTDSGIDSGVAPVYEPAPVDSPSACVITVARKYISNAPVAELRGSFSGMNWSAGPVSSQLYGTSRIKFVFSAIAPGTYDFSYVDPTGGTPTATAWAQYGDPSQLAKMSPIGRSYLVCTIDPGGGHSECHARVEVKIGCDIVPAGNM